MFCAVFYLRIVETANKKAMKNEGCIQERLQNTLVICISVPGVSKILKKGGRGQKHGKTQKTRLLKKIFQFTLFYRL